jgi:hypothetical protein
LRVIAIYVEIFSLESANKIILGFKAYLNPWNVHKVLLRSLLEVDSFLFEFDIFIIGQYLLEAKQEVRISMIQEIIHLFHPGSLFVFIQASLQSS